MICPRCGKRFASQASVLNHQKQISSKCWKTYSLLLELQQQQPEGETNSAVNEQPMATPPSPRSQCGSPLESTPPQLEVDQDSSPLMPSETLLEVDMEIDDDNNQQAQPQGEAPPPSFHTEYFLGSAEVFGSGETYLDLFDEDENADKRQTNPYYPFASQPEWELASFLLKSDLSRVAIDQFLKLQLVSASQSFGLPD
jgi:hypothetical protein